MDSFVRDWDEVRSREWSLDSQNGAWTTGQCFAIIIFARCVKRDI